VTCPISADREFSIEIGLVANLKIKNLEIVNKTTNHEDIVSTQAPNLINIILWCRRRTFLCVNTWPILVANFGDQLSSLKSDWLPISVMEIGSLNQP
jgi:hypothetical protein